MEIAEHLNREKIIRQANRAWDSEAVRRVRYNYGFHLPDANNTRRRKAVRADGLYSVRGIAEKLGVKPALVNNWANTGLLPIAEGGKTTKTRWFQLNDDLIARLLVAKAKRYGAASVQNKDN